MSQTNDELKREFEKVVDLLVQIESARESISSLLKDIKAEYGDTVLNTYAGWLWFVITYKSVPKNI